MSTPPQPREVPYEGYGYEDRGYAWVIFAALLLVLAGTMDVIEGIAAIGNAHFFVHNTHYVFGDLKTWGWIVLIIGMLQLAAAAGVFVRNPLARWGGVVILGLSALAQLLMMPAYPFWSLALFAIDVLAVYGLIAYGKRIGEG